MRDDAVQRNASLLVVVHSIVDIGPEETTALRRAESVGVVNRARARVAVLLGLVLEEGHDVSHRRHSQPDDIRARSRIDQLVDSSRLEPASEIDVIEVGFDLLVLDADELELVPGYVGRGAVRVVANGESRAGFVGVGRRVRIVNPVREQEDVCRLVALELAQHTSREPAAVRVQRLGRAQADPVRVVFRNVGLPAAKDDGVPLAHQESVARMQWGARVHDAWRTVEPKDRLASPVDYVEDDAAPSAVGIRGLEHFEVRREGHPSLGVARGQLYVGDGAVIGVKRVNREVGGALQMIVSSHVAECLSARERGDAGYIELGYWQVQIPFLQFRVIVSS